MHGSLLIKRALIALAIVAALIVAVALMLFLRGRMQQQAGLVNTEAPTFTATPTPVNPLETPDDLGYATPTAIPTPYVDPCVVQGGDRGLLVAAIQARLYTLGYFSYKPTGYFAVMTQNSVRAFQQANNLLVDGVVSEQTLFVLFSSDSNYAYTTPVPLPTATPPSVRPRNYGEAMLFSNANALMPVGSEFLVVDLKSQLYFNAIRMGGTNHMDIAPASDEDMQRYLAIFSGRSVFDKRPCVVEYQDHIIATSLCGWLHTADPIGATQTLCLYFFGSTANDSAMEDAEHSANLLFASDGATPVEQDSGE